MKNNMKAKMKYKATKTKIWSLLSSKATEIEAETDTPTERMVETMKEAFVNCLSNCLDFQKIQTKLQKLQFHFAFRNLRIRSKFEI